MTDRELLQEAADALTNTIAMLPSNIGKGDCSCADCITLHHAQATLERINKHLEE